MEIKPADLSACETVCQICHQTIRAVYSHYYPAGAVAFFLEHHSKEAIQKDILNNAVFLLEEQDGIVGTFTINENEINRLFVLPEYQKHGYGRLAMDFAEARIFAQYPFVTLSASLPAQRMYEKRGYRAVSFDTIPCANGDILSYPTMEKHRISTALCHMAVYVLDLEREKDFFVRYFGAECSAGYHNKTTGFMSYFLSFGDGARLEIMTRPALAISPKDAPATGFAHIAISVGKKALVDALTLRLQADGYCVKSQPRTTGDGYYESVVLDAEGNEVEITE